jgi:16S rRNA G966 N2-methylase RsmD
MAYTDTFKKDVLKYYKANGITKTANYFKIYPDTIRYWVKPEHRLKVLEKENKKYSLIKQNLPRKPYNPEKKEYFKNYQRYLKQIKIIPRIHYTEKQRQKEIDTLLTTPGSYNAQPIYNRCILTFQQHFYDKERELYTDKKIAKKILQNREYYLQKNIHKLTQGEILRGFKISGTYYGYSHFSPLWFKKFITDFNIKSVYDPCGGWGHRLLGILGTDLEKYYYNDFDLRTVKGVEQIAQFAGISSRLEATNFKAEKFILGCPVDAIFTCPPYYNKETYNNKTFKNIEDYSVWWSTVVKNALQTKCKYFAVIIDNEHENVIKQPLNNYHLLQQNVLGKKRSHFTKESSAYEALLVYEII